MAKDPLVNCPRDCGTMVPLSKSGDPHTVVDLSTDPPTHKICK